MKPKRPLSPPLAHVQRRLFGVSPELIAAVVRHETSPAIAEAVRQSPEWAEYQTDIPVLQAEDLDPTPVRIPDAVRDLIRRKVTAREAHHTESIPKAGQIVELRQIRTPRAQPLDWVMQVPLYVVLDAQAETDTVWHGWLVSGEADYATWWDFVLQVEDEPFTPEASMVQLWNPVRVYVPMAERVVGQLSPQRLQALRALAAEYVTGKPPDSIPVWPGRVAERLTLGDLPVVTGSPLGGEDDPRHEYRHYYFYAAEAVRQPARLALAESVVASTTPASLLERWLKAGREQLGAVLHTRPQIAVAMNARSSTVQEDLIWEPYAQIRIEFLEDDGAGCVSVTALSAEPVSAEIRVAEAVENRVTVTADQPPVRLYWDIQPGTWLVVSAGGECLELPLIV